MYQKLMKSYERCNEINVTSCFAQFLPVFGTSSNQLLLNYWIIIIGRKKYPKLGHRVVQLLLNYWIIIGRKHQP
jgi:hypothetical protein